MEWERHAEQMQLLEYIYAALVNQHLESGKQYKPPSFVAHMPDDFFEPKQIPHTVSNDEMAAKLDAFIKANTR